VLRAVYTHRVMFDRLWKKPAAPKAPPSPNDVGALFLAQTRFFDRDACLSIVDAGVHLGHSSKEYLDAFPNCRVFGLEPEDRNFAAAGAMLAPYGSRMELRKHALSETDSTDVLQVNTHDGTHSLLEIGDGRYWEGPAETLHRQSVETISLDKFCSDRKLDSVDILKMDIQGGELQALKGAAELLGRGAISLIALEVLFKPLYKAQPLFWDVADYLRSFGYGLHGLFECHYHSRNPHVLSWADAIFTAPQLQALE
jgi:FkbM family methyltransferase